MSYSTEMDLEVLELTLLSDLAVAVHFQESIEWRPFSKYGHALQPPLKDITRRSKKLGGRFDHQADQDDAA